MPIKPPAARFIATLTATLATSAGLWNHASAQTAQRPSFYRSHAVQSDAPDAAPELPAIETRADFDRMARVYDAGTPMELPHLLFVIDRKTLDAAGRERVHYVNSRRYTLHEQYVVARHLSPPLSHAALTENYRAPNRRFIFGVVSWQPALRRWVWEAWEGDQLTPLLTVLAQSRLQATFFEPLAFKANSTTQEAAARAADIAFVTQAEVVREQPFMPLNTGQRSGRLRLIDSVEATPDLQPSDIVVLREVPLTLPPVAGVITTRPSTVLSHVNLLAKGWGIPNAYVRDAFERLRAQNGQWVSLTVTRSGYQLTPDPQAEQRAARAASKAGKVLLASNISAAAIVGDLPLPDTTHDAIIELANLRAKDHHQCGSKAANLGEIAASIQAGLVTNTAPVPDGFCIPFAQYVEFMNQPAVRKRIAQAESSPGVDIDPARRQAELEALRRDLVELPVSNSRAQAWLSAWNEQLGGVGAFVRSSSNSEDLPGFSGAGLYSTVPNVTGDEALVRAVKAVWASVFNFEAYEARRVARISLDHVAMGVFVQQAVASRSSGVMVTCDPFDSQHRGATYISAKRGLGIKVVEGKRVAEQVLYDRRSRAVQVITRSAEDNELQLDQHGGVKEVAIDPTRAVLNDALVRRLANVGQQLRNVFGGREQDVEWATDDQGRLVILQARPFVVGK